MKLNPKYWNSVIATNVLQFIFIFSSVYFAFWLTERRATKELENVEALAIEAITKELRSNLIELEKSQIYHDALVSNLQYLYDSLKEYPDRIGENSLMDLFSAQVERNGNTIAFPFISRVSWDSFKQSQAFMVMDYELSNVINKHFRLQELGVESTALKMRDFFFSNEMYEERVQLAQLLRLIYLFQEINGQEVYLINSTKMTIELLAKNYDQVEETES
ncbi:hypothetical protein [Marinoscillum pacificum]|uniref:hypothetical protein n=1 Tax=Marinoscillum pacificum TaxID=392723 RepID=UPI0021579A32|nr:hypothetical protein [Marinoscillum pacificum]